MEKKDWCVVVLAAGKGKRMESSLPKVLHEVAGMPMVLRVCEAASVVSDNMVIVVGHKAEQVKSAVLKSRKVKFALQKEQRGTGDAVKSAVSCIEENVKNIMVVCGDTPLITSKTLEDFARHHENGNFEMSILGMELDDPSGYGRLVQDERGTIVRIVEQADADEKQKLITLVNSGVYCFKKDFLVKGLLKIDCTNAQEEYYLTDLAKISSEKNNNKIGCHILNNPVEALGVNSKKELESVKALLAGSLSMA